jgi:hypothetical protein
MYRYSLPLALALALACSAIPLRAAQQAAQPPQGKRIWTTDDMDQLRAQGLISIVGPEVEATPAAAPAAPSATPGPVYASRTEDPAWYADQAADLQTQLSARQTALAQAQDNLAQAGTPGGTSASVNLAAGDTVGVTPEEVIANLEAEVVETQARLDDLADLARRNDIAPGVLRVTPA